MAEVLLRSRVGGSAIDVGSAGLLPGGSPPPSEVARVMAERGLDVTAHRSRQIDPALIRASDLVVCMTRDQLLEVVLMAGPSWGRCYTLVDLVRRAEVVGGLRAGGEARWLSQLEDQRDRAELLRLRPSDDIADPMGRRVPSYRKTARALADLTATLSRLLGP